MSRLVQPLIQRLQLLGQALGELVAELAVKFPDALDLFLPQGLIHAQQTLQGGPVDAGALQVDVLRLGLEADGGFSGSGLVEAALHNPLQHPQVVAEAGPDEVPFLVGAEPVDIEKA